MILEIVKNNINEVVLIRLLQEHKLECSSDRFKQLISFINSKRGKIFHNLNQLELNPLPKFREMEWSQILYTKSSNIDSIKERNYMIDLFVDDQLVESNGEQNKQNTSSVFSMILSQKELQDLHFTLSDCAKSIETFLRK